MREMQEELGITEDDIEDISLRYITLRHTKEEMRQNYYFFARPKQNFDLVSNEGILKWFPMNELHELEMHRLYCCKRYFRPAGVFCGL